MTLDRINEYFAFATSALVTGVGVMTVTENLALAGLLLGLVSAVRLAIHPRRIEQASQRGEQVPVAADRTESSFRINANVARRQVRCDFLIPLH